MYPEPTHPSLFATIALVVIIIVLIAGDIASGSGVIDVAISLFTARPNFPQSYVA